MMRPHFSQGVPPIPMRVLRWFFPVRERERASGWLDCPNCHEHAQQDVVDRMTFLALWFWRLTPVRRHRLLVCRKCGYRRPATPQEMSKLNTAGKPVHRAWLAPIGGLPIYIVVAVILLINVFSSGAAAGGVSLVKDGATGLAPLEYERPSTWIQDLDTTGSVPRMLINAQTGGLQIIIERVADGGGGLDQLLKDHFADFSGLNSSGLPTTPPAGKDTTVAKQKARRIELNYKQQGQNAQAIIYAFQHGGVGYVLTFVANSDAQITQMKEISAAFVESMTFTKDETASCSTSTATGAASPAATTSTSTSTSTSSGASSTPAPCPSPSPSPSAATPSPTPTH